MNVLSSSSCRSLDHHYPAKMCSQRKTPDLPRSKFLKATHSSLSPLHFELAARNVPKSSAITLRISPSVPPVPALVLTGTSRCFILDSFYNEHIAKIDFGGLKMSGRLQLDDMGVSHCEFDAAQSGASEGSQLNKPTTQDFPGRITGAVHLPFVLDGHKFIHFFLLLDRIFVSEEIQARFHAVMGTDFLKKCCLRTQWTSDGFELRLPKAMKLPKQLCIHTSGSCISDSASGRCKSRAGYGMHFVGLPQETNWDIWSPLGSNEMKNEDQVKLIAVLHAAHLVSERCHLMEVRIITDSEYVFHGVHDWFPNWKETHEKGGLRLKDIDRFDELDKVLRLVERLNLLKIEVCWLPWVENLTAYGLATKGAEFTLASQLLQSHDLEGKKEDSTKDLEQRMLELSCNVIKEVQPLIQWSPIGTHWLEWKSMAESEHLNANPGLRDANPYDEVPRDADSYKEFLGDACFQEKVLEHASSHKQVLRDACFQGEDLGERLNLTGGKDLGFGTGFSFTASYEKARKECNILTRDEYLVLYPNLEAYEQALLDLESTSDHIKAPKESYD